MRKAGSRKVPGDSPNPRSVLLSVKLDALSLPALPHEIVIFSLAGREKVGPRREMGVVETVHRHASATVEANPLLGPAIPTPLVILGSVCGKEVLATPPVIKTIDIGTGGGGIPLDLLLPPAVFAKVSILLDAGREHVVAIPAIVEPVHRDCGVGRPGRYQQGEKHRHKYSG